MQISTSTLLASQQQVQRAQPRTAAQPAFEPMAFKQATKTAAPEAATMTANTQTPPGTGPTRPGTRLDIKV